MHNDAIHRIHNEVQQTYFTRKRSMILALKFRDNASEFLAEEKSMPLSSLIYFNIITDGYIIKLTYSLLKGIPVWRRIIEYLVLQRHSHLAEEIVTAEHVRVPDRQPQCSRLQATQAHMELKTRDDETSNL